MKIYHATTRDKAKHIQENGFDAERTVEAPSLHKDITVPIDEVYFADRPLLKDESLGDDAEVYFAIEVNENAVAEYEVLDEANEQVDYREWAIPPEVANALFTDRTIHDCSL